MDDLHDSIIQQGNSLFNLQKRRKQLEKKIAVIGTRGFPSYYGGFETAVRRLAPYFADKGWNVTVYGRPQIGKTGIRNTDTRINSIITRGIDNKNLSTITYGLSSTFHAAISRPNAALIMNVANGYWLPLLKLRGIRTAVNVDGMEWERDKWNAFAKFVFKLGARLTALFADEIIADSKEIARRWNNEFGRSSTYIPYGGDIKAETQLADDLTRGTYILVVARFVPENTIPEFFDAIPFISRDIPVVVVGSSGYADILDERARELASKYPNFRWLGHISDDARLAALWQHAGAYFHGHSVGGTNPALVQAMAMGSPIVARDTVYNREVLGELGRYVDQDARSIADALEQQVRETESDAFDATAIIRRAGDKYNWAKVCADYESLLSQLIGEPTPDCVAP
ncbi:DUF1972 domain-containing protein [Kocuria rosea]|uniref:DUF1972 domain-containing protein n=1 Tax=Kocuria rosea TaxID=1275 RepID=UPI00203D9523|nr:DUF1972 domain-containing protein [Kocuria rosea]